ncbi:MAG TPA: hypothetical protein VGF45_20480 [Polyangia bacterium]
MKKPLRVFCGLGSLPAVSSALLLAVLPAASGCKTEQAYTVLSTAEAAKLRRPCSRDFPSDLTGPWTPSARDLEAPEKAIDAAVAEQLSRLGTQAAIVPPKYKRQYAGFERAGRGVIYVNAVSEAAIAKEARPAAWKESAVRLCDGGIESFGAVYDPASGRFDKFQFNAPFSKKAAPEPEPEAASPPEPEAKPESK